MRRREFIAYIGAVGLWPLPTSAQQGERMRRVGVLVALTSDDAEVQARLAAFREALQKLGWADGRNVRIDVRFGAGDLDRVRKNAAELAGSAPDVILATGNSSLGPLAQA